MRISYFRVKIFQKVPSRSKIIISFQNRSIWVSKNSKCYADFRPKGIIQKMYQKNNPENCFIKNPPKSPEKNCFWGDFFQCIFSE